MTPEKLREMKVDLIDASVDISKYYTVSNKTKTFRKVDTDFVPVPDPEKASEKKGIFERAIGMFL